MDRECPKGIDGHVRLIRYLLAFRSSGLLVTCSLLGFPVKSSLGVKHVVPYPYRGIAKKMEWKTENGNCERWLRMPSRRQIMTTLASFRVIIDQPLS